MFSYPIIKIHQYKTPSAFVSFTPLIGTSPTDVIGIADIKGLLTEREVCTVKYRTEVFRAKKPKSDISRYRPNKRGQ